MNYLMGNGNACKGGNFVNDFVSLVNWGKEFAFWSLESTRLFSEEIWRTGKLQGSHKGCLMYKMASESSTSAFSKADLTESEMHNGK